MTPERLKRMENVLKNRRNDASVLLENVFNPHNIAAVMRTCDAVGIGEIFVLNTLAPPLKYFGKNSSSSAEKWLEVHQFDTTSACLEAIKQKYPIITGTHLTSEALCFWDYTPPNKICYVFGNEGDGISLDVLKHLDNNIFIPQVGMVKSLNISVACAIILYEDFRRKSLSETESLTCYKPEKQQNILKKWLKK